MKKMNRVVVRAFKVCAVLLLALPLLHCGDGGGSVCAKAASVDLAAKSEACKNDQGFSISVETPGKATCEANISKCNTEDLAKIETYVTCLNNVPACESGKGGDFVGKILACATSVSVSADCQAALKK